MTLLELRTAYVPLSIASMELRVVDRQLISRSYLVGLIGRHSALVSSILFIFAVIEIQKMCCTDDFLYEHSSLEAAAIHTIASA